MVQKRDSGFSALSLCLHSGCASGSLVGVAAGIPIQHERRAIATGNRIQPVSIIPLFLSIIPLFFDHSAFFFDRPGFFFLVAELGSYLPLPGRRGQVNIYVP